MMKITFLLVRLGQPVEVPDSSQKSADKAAQSLKLHGGNIYVIEPGGKLDQFIREYPEFREAGE